MNRKQQGNEELIKFSFAFQTNLKLEIFSFENNSNKREVITTANVNYQKYSNFHFVKWFISLKNQVKKLKGVDFYIWIVFFLLLLIMYHLKINQINGRDF